jgi:hypothetical protein
MNIDEKYEEMERFVSSLNREDLTVQKVFTEIVKKESTLTSDLDRNLFRDVVYGFLWCEPENLTKRREAGELDLYW